MYYITVIQDYIFNCSTESGLQLKTVNPFCDMLSVVTLVLHSVHCLCSLRSVLSTHHDSFFARWKDTNNFAGRKGIWEEN